ncbi:MAG TPA: CHAT domain-containing protein [Solirubrobacteraceae bacterium]|nr:CHAT domain-containing protein [Solirubrobacteraceae bacterium]
MNITKTDTNVAPSRARRLEDTWPQATPSGLFVAALLERRLSHVTRDRFSGTAAPQQLARLGHPVLVRADRASDEVEALLLVSGDSLVLIDAGYGDVGLEVAGTTRAEVDEAARMVRRALESPAPQTGRVPVAFWIRGNRRGDVRLREIDAPRFETIADNYAKAAREALERLLLVDRPEQGRLILWRGEPGTGKSHALRALVRAWSSWCSAHFIIDPEELFGHAGAYMLDVLTWDGDDDDKWRLVILEDSGELIASDARTVAGQALSRLLNITDGLLGQGMRTVVLITTNEPVKHLHPATRRAGRCLADIEFAALSTEEANGWLRARGEGRRVDNPTTLAELYRQPTTHPATAHDSAPTRFGFARALADTDQPKESARRTVSTSASKTRTHSSNSSRRPTHEYDELRLRIDASDERSYRVLATARFAEAAGRLELPFSDADVEDFISRVSQPYCRDRIYVSALAEAKRFGAELFTSLFRDQVYGLYRDALSEARSRGRGLRITLCLSGAPALITVPWEYLFDAPRFLAMSRSTPVVRYLDLPRGQRSLAVEPPLRILGIASSPADYARLDTEREHINLERALARLATSGAVELCWLEQATLESLVRALQTDTFHALHYVGHGNYDTQSNSGLLMFEDDSGWGMPVNSEQLGTILHEFDSLRLVVLNACEGARTAGTNPFAGIAESIVQCEVPAVIAMQSEITDDAASVFADGFYTAIATGSPVDAAVAAGRFTMFANRSDGIAWGTPVLYMRVADGRILVAPNASPNPARLSLTS